MLNILNTKLFFFINGAVGVSPILDYFFVFVSNFFVQAMIALTLIWFFVVLPKKTRTFGKFFDIYKQALLFLLSLGVVILFLEIIKSVVAFPRPIQTLTGVHSLLIDGSYDSFPSLHTALAFVPAVFVYKYSKSSGTIMFLMAVLVGVSRVFVGVHFPLDVICGALIGIVIPWGIISIFKPSRV